MARQTGDWDHATSQSVTRVKRRVLLRFGTLITALTGASAISAIGASGASGGAGDNILPTAYIPMSEKGAALGVATLDVESRIPPALLPDLSAIYEESAYTAINVAAMGADPSGGVAADAIIQAAIDAAEAKAQAGGGTRKVLLAGSAFVKRPTYTLNGRIKIPKYVVVEAESGMTTIKCGTAGAGIDMGDGLSTPYHAELNNVLVDANFIADNPVVFNKVSEAYSRRLFITNLTDAGQGIKIVDCLGLTLENPSISRNSLQPHGIGVGIRVTGRSAGYVVVRDHNFFNLRDAFRFETGVSNLVVNEGWNEGITNYFTVASTAFASFGQLNTNNSHFPGTDATHRLFYLEKADSGYSIANADWTKCRFIGANVTSALIDVSATANTAGTTSFNLDKNEWQLGSGAAILAKHTGTPWYQTYLQLANFKGLPFAKLPVHGVDCQLTHISSLGWNRFANGLSVNGDPARTDGHMKWNGTTKRWQLDTTNTGVYSDIPVAGDYSSAVAVADKTSTFATGTYYSPRGSRGAFATVQDRLTIIRFPVPKSQRFVRIGVEVTVAAAGSVIRLGTYQIGSNGVATAITLDAGTIDSSTAGAKELVIDIVSLGGVIGLGAVAQGGRPTVRTITGGGADDVGSGSLRSATLSNPNTGFYMSGITGSLPEIFVMTDRTPTPTLVVLRTA